MKKIFIAVIALVAMGMLPGIAKKGNKTQVSQNLNVFNAIYKELQDSYVDTLDPNKEIRNAIDYMLSQIDPYTEYYPVEDQDALKSISSGEFSGIGAYISQRDGKVIISEPSWGSPALQAGLRHGDVIVAIDGDTLPPNYTSAEASKRLRGQAGTKVKVTVDRPYVADSILDFEIVRGTIRNTPVPYYGMLSDEVGYISLTTFSEKSAQQVKDALLDLKKNPNLKSLVLDLRQNGGGLLESAVEIVGMFVPKGTEVVQTKYREADNQKTYKTTQKPIDTEIPLAVLIDGNTASSSEIVSGALQDLDRAVIIGERSYGKGLVQTSRLLPYDGLLKLTVARYYIPSGRLIQAIDYSHRNADGTPARIPDSLTNVFKTKIGREVRDGGGITPDVKVKSDEGNRLLYSLVQGYWPYDYATRFAYRQGDNMPSAADFEITDSIFDDFKAFVDPEKFNYDKFWENGIKTMRDITEKEGYMTDSISAMLTLLESLLKRDLNQDLDFNKKTIKMLLDTEISQRYYSEGDRVMRSLKTDAVADTAVAVLKDQKRYREILTPNGKKSE